MLEWIISSAVLLAAVIAVRYALRGRLRPGVQYAMWAIVLVRLLVPVSFGSGAYSAGTAAAALEQTPAVQAVLTPSMDYDAAYSQVAREYAGRGLDVSELAPRQQQAMDREIRALQRPTAVQVLQWVWLGGMAAMALTLTGTNLRLYIRLRRSRRELTREGRMPVYVTEAVDTPCLFGLVRPAVYLTPEAAGDDVTRQHSVAHELTHLRHGDHVWSLLRCVCLAVHWYDPLVWWAAVLSRRDAELACDDATIRRLGEVQRAAYGRTLVRMTCRRPGNLLVTATTMTDGAGGIRERIRCIAKRPRTTVYTAVVLVLVCGWVLHGGCDRAVQTCSTLVPWMSALYLFGCGVILFHFRQNIPSAFSQILTQAFSSGGIAGAAGSGVGFFTCVRVGISRGIFTHEAGLGSASIAHACSGADSPVEQGFWGIFEVFCDTILVCTITALSILASGVPLGASSAYQAFCSVMGKTGGRLLGISLSLFAFASVISFCLYGQRCVEYLFGDSRRALPILDGVAEDCKCLCVLEPVVFALADLLNACLLLPNLIVLLILSPQVFSATREYCLKGATHLCSSVHSNHVPSSKSCCAQRQSSQRSC